MGVYTGGRVLLSTPASKFMFSHYRRVIAVLTAGQVFVTVVVSMPVWHLMTGVNDRAAFAVFGVYCALMAAASLAREGVHGIGKHVLATVSDVVAATVQISLGLTLHLINQVTVSSLLGCGVAGFLLQLLMCNLGARDRSRERQAGSSTSPGPLRITYRVVLFSFPGLILAVGQLFIQKGDRLILGIFSQPRDVGIYAAGATIADAAWILPASLSVIVVRQVARSGSLEPLRRWRRPILVLTCISSIVLAISGSTLIELLLGSSYQSALPILWILCVGSPLFASQQLDLAACNGAGRLDVGATVTAWGVMTLVILSLGLIPAYQGVGAALASVGAYGCMAVLARLGVRRIQSERDNDGLEGGVDAAIPLSSRQAALDRMNFGL
ncbi:MAG: lipopolysaccharide biosynthesis protein [Nakamurella sp.]